MGALKYMTCDDCFELNCVCDLMPGSGFSGEMTPDQFEAYMAKKIAMEDAAFDERMDNLADFDTLDSGDLYE